MSIKSCGTALSALAFVVVSASPGLSQNAMTPGGGAGSVAIPTAPGPAPGGPAMAVPKAVAPAHGTMVGGTDPKAPIALRWTPVVPRPQEPTTYRVRVWQLMQGQDGPQAIRANKPIFEKDVDNLTDTSIASPPCRQKSCSFVWTVQALSRDGKPIGGNNGTSDPFGFTTTGVAADSKR